MQPSRGAAITVPATQVTCQRNMTACDGVRSHGVRGERHQAGVLPPRGGRWRFGRVAQSDCLGLRLEVDFDLDLRRAPIDQSCRQARRARPERAPTDLAARSRLASISAWGPPCTHAWRSACGPRRCETTPRRRKRWLTIAFTPSAASGRHARRSVGFQAQAARLTGAQAVHREQQHNGAVALVRRAPALGRPEQARPGMPTFTRGWSVGFHWRTPLRVGTARAILGDLSSSRRTRAMDLWSWEWSSRSGRIRRPGFSPLPWRSPGPSSRIHTLHPHSACQGHEPT